LTNPNSIAIFQSFIEVVCFRNHGWSNIISTQNVLDHMTELFQTVMDFLLWIGGTLLAIILFIAGYIILRNRRLRGLYEVMWQSSSSLTPRQIMRIRANPDVGYSEYYYPREEAEAIKEKILAGKHVLVIGNPLAGKTRAVFETFKRLKPRHDVIIPKIADISDPAVDIPIQLRRWRKQILFLDDLNQFFAKQNFQALISAFLRDEKTVVVATCRSGPEYDALCQSNERELSLFGKPVEMPKIASEKAREIAKEAGKTIPERFDGNIGSIFVPLEAMRVRYNSLEAAHKGILRAIKRLYEAGIFTGRQEFALKRVKLVSEKAEGITGNPEHVWKEQFNTLRQNGFIEIDKDLVQLEEAYLDFVVEDIGDKLENLRRMLEVFREDAGALVYIGIRSYDIGPVDLRKREFQKTAIEAYTEALKVYTLADYPMQYGMTQNNLGNAYNMLAEVEEKGANCAQAIAAYIEALRVYTLADFPMHYGATQNNLGYAYSTLAEVEEKGANCRLAIAAYKEALKVRTPADSMGYVMTQNNLGAAYRTLAEVEEKGANCGRAIAACIEALRVYTLADFPMDYGMTQNNLGNAYQTLAEVEEKGANCGRAIAAYTEALRVYTLADFPMDYGMTQNNLGTAYGRLAVVEDKETNCEKAREAFAEALKVYTKDETPVPYEMVIGNLEQLEAFCGDESGPE